jgi:hypothetical protein
LTVGARGHEPEGRAATDFAEVQEPGDCWPALVLVRFGRHREPGVVGGQQDNAFRIAALDRSGETADEIALAHGTRKGCAFALRKGLAIVDGRSRPLKRPFDRRFAAVEHRAAATTDCRVFGSGSTASARASA